jgi:WD40 repeat protein
LAIATASVIECRNASDGRLIGRLEETLGTGGPHFQPPLLVVTPDGSRVFFGHPARVWTIGASAAAMMLQGSDLGFLVDLTDDGKVALTAPDERELLAIETATGQRIGRIRNSREFSCLTLARDGRSVATGDYEHDVKLWDLTRLEIQPPSWERRGRVRSVAICDDRRVAFVAAENAQELWDTATGEAIGETGKHATARALRRGRPLGDPRPGQEVRAKLEKALGAKKGEMAYPGTVPVGVLAFSRAAGRAVSAPGYLGKYSDMQEAPYDPAGADYPLTLWDLKNTRKPRLLGGHTMPVTCADMTGDGTRALSGSWGRLLRLWDLDTGACLKILRGHRGMVLACALAEDADLAVSGSEDMTVRLWDLVQGKLLFTFAASSAVTACDIARDGSVAIAAEVSGRVHVFSVDRLIGWEP